MKHVSFKPAVLALAALMVTGAMGAAVAEVQVDQSPLIVSEPLPPNIILMYDDSGSMAWDFMPGSSTGFRPSGDDFNDSSVNRIYYNPEVLYEVPPNADGTRMREPSFPRAFDDVFDLDDNGTDDVTRASRYSDEFTNRMLIPGVDTRWECRREPGGEWISTAGECEVEDDYYLTNPSGGEQFCDASGGRWVWNYYCVYDEGTVRPDLETEDACLSGYGRYYHDWDGTDYACFRESEVDAFLYIQGGERHYVIRDSDSCDGIDNCHHASDPLEIEGVDTTYGQNVANFYSYYRDRDFAAKSGILTAFSGLNPEYRVGYGSINSNNGGLRAPYRFGSVDQVDLDDGQTPNHVRREAFWEWMQEIYSNSGTPLRSSLKRIGDYYEDENTPWEAGYDESGNYSSEQYSCRQSYAILLTDGYWNGSNPSVGNADNESGSEILSPDGQTSYEYSPRKPFLDAHSNTLADVAMEYWKRDLRGLKNDVPTTGRDPGFWQHMTTFTIGLGVSPVNIEPNDATMPAIFEWARTGADPTSFDGSQFSWPEPDDDEPETITDLAHAAVNGHGGFYSAADPRAFTKGLQEALAAIDNASGAGNSVSLSEGSVVGDGSSVFVGKYVTGEWSGSLKAFSYSTADGGFTTEEWSAAAMMPAADVRNIWTTDASGSVVEFKAGALSNAQKTALESNIETAFDVSADDIVAYLRGVRDYEDGDSTPLDDKATLRQRASLLGDIVTSTPVPIGPPQPKAAAFEYVSSDFTGLSAYTSFANTHSDRDEVVYVAANDGMLHAFDAETGEEIFAYLPGSLLSASGDASLARYANPDYGVYDEVDGSQPIPHQYYNDGELTTENVFIDGAWKTILVGTTGRGPARTIYALDITDPDVLADPDSAEDAVLWERSASDGGDYAWIGQVLGRPTIWQVPAESDTTKWVALVGNGPNSGDGKAALLQFDLTDGSIEVMETNSQSDNGLAAPTVVLTEPEGGVADYAFAGDLRGNVWQFDLADGTSTRLFQAVGPADEEQPITARMNATAHPDDGSIWVFFGTGRYLNAADIDVTEVQSIYGLRVQPKSSGKPVVDEDSTRGDDLLEREILAQEENGSVTERATELAVANDMQGNAGWYMDLIHDGNDQGERVLNIAQLVAGNLYVTTMIPIAGDPCEVLPPGATMVVDPFTGANPGSPFLDLDGDGTYETITDGNEDLPTNAYISKVGVAGAPTFATAEDGETIGLGQTLSGELINLPAPVAGGTGATRLNWQELFIR